MMIKPDAVERSLTGRILSRVEEAGLRILRLRMVRLTPEQARDFYKVHEGKPFLDSLVAFMAGGPIVAAVLEGEDAIDRLEKIVGATDPANAEEGTIRKEFGLNIEKNSVHRSDAPETAENEIAWFDLNLALRPEPR
ncbi:MAG: nucleoside-diphosphate kinase [Candidatus Eisenbacteria bacterium]|nr:nucleoside-diphosphate kinase [Candidatus Latescibacterota bacterium]MBD3302387.1 nucleoside-diphosphate kinase [Candidatus Eisenbacteria bacterium]